ncbi:transmembrane protein 87A isoform 1 [Cricetulus griseus]|nr:transmembrane protein 87A isoform 1 [Cricetulus griseus]
MPLILCFPKEADEVESYLENLKEKKGLSGRYQTSSKLFQNCSELYKAQFFLLEEILILLRRAALSACVTSRFL